MTAEIENLALEHLRAIGTTLTDQSERLERVALRLSAIERNRRCLNAGLPDRV